MPKSKTKVQELGLKGKGVEPLVIPAIEKAADKFHDAKSEVAAQQEAFKDAAEELTDKMTANKDKLVKEVGGGFSYRFGDRVVTLKPGRERISVKSIHDQGMPAES